MEYESTYKRRPRELPENVGFGRWISTNSLILHFAPNSSYFSSFFNFRFYIWMSLQIGSEFFCCLKSWIDDIYLRADLFDYTANIGIMCTTKNNCFYITIKFSKMILEYSSNQFSFKNSIFYERNKFWSGDFLNLDGIIDDMNSLFVGTIFDSRFSGKNSHFSIFSFENSFGTRDSDSKNFLIWKFDLLKIPNGVSGCGIAGKYDNSSTLIEKELYSFFGILTNSSIVESSVGTSCIVAEIEIVIFGKYFPKLF